MNPLSHELFMSKKANSAVPLSKKHRKNNMLQKSHSVASKLYKVSFQERNQMTTSVTQSKTPGDDTRLESLEDQPSHVQHAEITDDPADMLEPDTGLLLPPIQATLPPSRDPLRMSAAIQYKGSEPNLGTCEGFNKLFGDQMRYLTHPRRFCVSSSDETCQCSVLRRSSTPQSAMTPLEARVMSKRQKHDAQLEELRGFESPTAAVTIEETVSPDYAMFSSGPPTLFKMETEFNQYIQVVMATALEA